jgi:hypothetical protein
MPFHTRRHDGGRRDRKVHAGKRCGCRRLAVADIGASRVALAVRPATFQIGTRCAAEVKCFRAGLAVRPAAGIVGQFKQRFPDTIAGAAGFARCLIGDRLL